MDQVLADQLQVAPPKEALALREAVLALDDEGTHGFPVTAAHQGAALLERDRELAVRSSELA